LIWKCQNLLEIIEKYIFRILNHGYDEDELTRVGRLRDYTGYIRKAAKRISERLDLDGYFTYYSARYSSAPLVLNEGVDKDVSVTCWIMRTSVLSIAMLEGRMMRISLRRWRC